MNELELLSITEEDESAPEIDLAPDMSEINNIENYDFLMNDIRNSLSLEIEAFAPDMHAEAALEMPQLGDFEFDLPDLPTAVSDSSDSQIPKPEFSFQVEEPNALAPVFFSTENASTDFTQTLAEQPQQFAAEPTETAAESAFQSELAEDATPEMLAPIAAVEEFASASMPEPEELSAPDLAADLLIPEEMPAIEEPLFESVAFESEAVESVFDAPTELAAFSSEDAVAEPEFESASETTFEQLSESPASTFESTVDFASESMEAGAVESAALEDVPAPTAFDFLDTPEEFPEFLSSGETSLPEPEFTFDEPVQSELDVAAITQFFDSVENSEIEMPAASAEAENAPVMESATEVPQFEMDAPEELSFMEMPLPEAPEIPAMTELSLEEPEFSLETPQFSFEAPEMPEVSEETFDLPELSFDAPEMPQIAVESDELPEPSFELPEFPETLDFSPELSFNQNETSEELPEPAAMFAETEGNEFEDPDFSAENELLIEEEIQPEIPEFFEAPEMAEFDQAFDFSSDFQSIPTLEEALPQFEEPHLEETVGIENKYIVFRLNGEAYAFSAASVAEISHPLTVTPLPFVPSWMSGVANLRGDIIAVIDLRLFWYQPAAAPGTRTKMLVVRAENENVRIGLTVDAVSEIRYIPASQISTAESNPNAPFASYLQGVSNLEGETMHILNAEQFLSAPKLRRFE